MKKIIALLLCLVILLLPFSAFAGELDFLKDNLNNVTYTANFSFTLNKPLDILSVLEQNDMLGEIENHVDLKMLVESVFGSATNYNVKLDMSDDFRKIRMEVLTDSVLPLDVNQNLSIDVAAKQGMWFDFDFTDAANPKSEIIALSPSYNKYVRITDEDTGIFNMAPTIPAEITEILTPEFFERIQEKSVELIMEYGKVNRTGNSCTIKFSDEAFKNLLFAGAEELVEEFADYFPEVTGADMAAAKGMLDGIKILGSDGITITYNLKNGKIDTMEEKCSIDMNLYDIVSYLGGELPEFITKENSRIAFTVNATASYSDFGSTTVTFPVLTEENTYKWPEYENFYSDYEYVPEPAWFIQCEPKELIYKDGSLMVPFRELIDSYLCQFEYGTDYTIDYKDGIIYFVCEEIGINELAFVTYKGDCWINGVKYNYLPSVNIEGTTFVESRMMEDAFNWLLETTGYDYIGSNAFVSYRNY